LNAQALNMAPPLLNLNADLGEGFGPWRMGDDAALLQIVNSANLACGFHAGDPALMRETVRLARQHGVSIGAHPAYPDLQGFGRRAMQMAPHELEAVILYQVGALQAIAAAEGTRVTHVKPHGALNNMACADAALAETVVRAVQQLGAGLTLLAPAHSELVKAAEQAGLPVRCEVFADRAYLDDGQLMPRSRPGAVLHEAEACVQHVRRMLRAGALIGESGHERPTRIDSVCVHGDGPQAVATARAVREALLAEGYRLVPLDLLN
jgi:5-oxoprolinase (ATP-hydrolysing) subunit A